MDMLAYIDPGSGSLLLQAVVAGLLAIPFFFRRTIGGFIGRIRGDRDPAASDPGASERADAEEPRR